MFNRKIENENLQLRQKLAEALEEKCRLAEVCFNAQKDTRYFRAHDENAQSALKVVREKNTELLEKIQIVVSDNDRLEALLIAHGIDPNEELPEDKAEPEGQGTEQEARDDEEDWEDE